MSSDAIAPPEPQEIDETRSMELRHLSANAGLSGRPCGGERCENCAYYLENTADISYCWHPKLRILVGANWWCEWWEKASEDEIPASAWGRPSRSNGSEEHQLAPTRQES